MNLCCCCMSWHSNIHFQRIVHRNTFPYTRSVLSRTGALRNSSHIDTNALAACLRKNSSLQAPQYSTVPLAGAGRERRYEELSRKRREVTHHGAGSSRRIHCADLLVRVRPSRGSHAHLLCLYALRKRMECHCSIFPPFSYVACRCSFRQM